jgi:hypothetical protein
VFDLLNEISYNINGLCEKANDFTRRIKAKALNADDADQMDFRGFFV